MIKLSFDSNLRKTQFEGARPTCTCTVLSANSQEMFDRECFDQRRAKEFEKKSQRDINNNTTKYTTWLKLLNILMHNPQTKKTTHTSQNSQLSLFFITTLRSFMTSFHPRSQFIPIHCIPFLFDSTSIPRRIR